MYIQNGHAKLKSGSLHKGLLDTNVWRQGKLTRANADNRFESVNAAARSFDFSNDIEIVEKDFMAEPARDFTGPSVSRKKPLKINVDLALYRARQTRLSALRARSAPLKDKLLRESEGALRKCLVLDPEDGRSYVMLGKLLVAMKRFDEALTLYEEGCTATGGTNAHIWTSWAYLAAQKGDTRLARKLYDAAIVANPQHAAAWHGWGLLERKAGDVVKARDLWTKGIEATLNDPNSYLYQSLAILAADLGRIEEARRWFRAGTKTLSGKQSHAMWHSWALMEEKQSSDPDVPRMLYRKGLEVSPRSRYIHLSWAMFEKSCGNISEARKLLSKGIDLNSRDAALFQAWGLLEEEEGNVEKARKLFKRGSYADKVHIPLWQAWGCMEFREGNLNEARELFQQGIWAAPPRARDVCLLFQAWAVLERSSGDVELARQLFKCAVKADPRSEPSWLAWAAMEEDLGAVQRADELRSFSMQERQEVVAPANFTTLPARYRGGFAEKIFARFVSFVGREPAGEAVELPAVLTNEEEIDPIEAARSG